MRQKMSKVIFLITVFLAASVVAENNAGTTGLWNTFDSDGNLLSTVNVKIENEKLYGNIIAVHIDGQKKPMCNKCKGDLQNKPMIGMQVLNGLSLSDGIWQNGTVLDPETGENYRAKVWLKNGKLAVRGDVGFVYDTLYWEKQKTVR
jgi:uncharacterized protein (DUF2147 family)